MKKILFVLALLAFLGYTRCNLLLCTGKANKTECNNVKPGDNDHCCWHEVENQQGFPTCIGINDEVYKKFSDYLKGYKETYKDKKISIDCSASYIKVALLGALLLLF